MLSKPFRNHFGEHEVEEVLLETEEAARRRSWRVDRDDAMGNRGRLSRLLLSGAEEHAFRS